MDNKSIGKKIREYRKKSNLNSKKYIKLIEISNILDELPNNEKDRVLDLFFSILDNSKKYISIDKE